MEEREITTPLSPVEAELHAAWHEAMDAHCVNPTPETWQRRLAAGTAYRAVYEWNRST